MPIHDVLTEEDKFDYFSGTRGGREDIFRDRLSATAGLNRLQRGIAQRGFGAQNASFVLDAISKLAGTDEEAFLEGVGPEYQGTFQNFLETGGKNAVRPGSSRVNLSDLRYLFRPQFGATDASGKRLQTSGEEAARIALGQNEGIIPDFIAGGLPGLLQSAIRAAIARRISAGRSVAGGGDPSRSAWEILFGIAQQPQI
jgi:hypothetical protein